MRLLPAPGVGTVLWMAPEVLAAQSYNTSADVYSYGIVMWEVAAQTYPWNEVPDDSFFAKALLAVIMRGQR